MTAEHEPMGLVYLSTAKALEVSDALGKMPELDEEHAGKWVLSITKCKMRTNVRGRSPTFWHAPFFAHYLRPPLGSKIALIQSIPVHFVILKKIYS